MVALEAVFHLVSVRGRRSVPAADFYKGLFTTALDSDEMLVQIDVPAQPPASGWAVQEFTRRHGDYAIVGVAANVQLDERNQCAAARLIYFSVGEGPTPASKAADGLIGQTPDEATIRAAAAVAAQQDIEPPGDIHAGAAYRRHLVEVLGRRALAEAFARAQMGRNQ
jgi:CO/xanthine dehydrogenase FAD-binding subunit